MVGYWKLEKTKLEAGRNAQNIANYKHQHRLGKIPLSELENELLREGIVPSRIDLFALSRWRNDKPPVNEDTRNLILHMKDTLSRVPEDERTREVKEKVWTEFMGIDTRGRVRCAGGGVKPSQYQKSLYENDVIKKKIREELLQEITESMREEKEQMNEEREQMRKELEAMREEREWVKGLMEQMARQMTQMRAERTQEVAEDVISYFGFGNFPATLFGPSTTPVRHVNNPLQPTSTPIRPSESRQIPDSSSTDRGSRTGGTLSTMSIGASLSSNDI